MKKIPLSRGQFAIVDDQDYEWLSQWEWYARWCPHTRSYYAQRRATLADGRKTAIVVHREILGLQRGDPLQGDHINHQTLDNRRANLRAVTSQENHFNIQTAKGYYWEADRNKYRAWIKVNRKLKYLGRFNTKEEARAAHVAAKAIHHQIHDHALCKSA